MLTNILLRHGTAFIDFSEYLFTLFSRTNFLWISVLVSYLFLASVSFLIFPCIQRPCQASFLFVLHLWEVCMSGIFMKDRIQPHGYESGNSVFCLMSLMDGCISSLSMACHSRKDCGPFSSAQTGIECQLDTLRGGGKSCTRI